MMWKNADALVANSQGLKKLATSFYDKKEILVIPNGADVRAFSGLDKANTDADKLVTGSASTTNNSQTVSISNDDADTVDNASECHLLFVSRLIERKGLQDILPQLQHIRVNCAESGVKLTLDIVGDGPFRENLETMVKELNISDNVIFHGQKSKDLLPAYYSKADVFLFPSRKEGMPNAVLEAMSYGLPIIMTPCQGSDELIDGNGYVTGAEGFGEKMRELALDREKRRGMGDRSTELIENVFSWHNTAEKYLELFNKLL